MMKKNLLVSKSMAVFPDRCKWSFFQHAACWLFWIQKWRHNAKTRKLLAGLPVHLLRDIGLTEQQVRREIEKKFWQ